MHLPTHGLLGWLLAESATLERRDRLLVFGAGLFPDLDALTVLGGPEFYQRYHHVILHNVSGAVAYTILAAALATRRLLVAGLALIGYHLHLLCDFVGSAGPDGSLWSVPYLVPFSFEDFYFQQQWGLASWQNVSVTVAAILVCIHLGARRGRTVVEVVSSRADAEVVKVFRLRWPWYHDADGAKVEAEAQVEQTGSDPPGDEVG
jgi:hypothetical protein